MVRALAFPPMWPAFDILTCHHIMWIKQCRSKGNISGGAREPLGGCGGMLPQKILKSKGLEMQFLAFSKSYL